MEIRNIETASFYLKRQLEKEFPNVEIQATYAPTVEIRYGTADEAKDKERARYLSFIGLTQRVVRDGILICYITYRSTLTTAVKPPKLSSYELITNNYCSICKYKLSECSSPEEAFLKMYKRVKALIEFR